MNDSQQGSHTIVLKTLAYTVILIISLLGNTLLILGIKRNINGRMITVSNLLIASVAVSDIMMSIWSFPERITRTVTNDKWLIHGTAGSILCKIVNFTEKLSITVSVLHLGALALERFLAVFCPYKTVIRTSYVKYITASIWIASAIYWSPILYYGKIIGSTELRCEVRRFVEHWKYWYLAFIIILCAVMVAILVLYTALAGHLCHRKVPGLRLASQRNKSEHIKRRVVVMVGVIIVTFYVCFLPYWIGWVWCSYASTMPEHICNQTYKFISIFLANTSCTTNPIICFTFIGYFRFAFKAILEDPFNRKSHELRVKLRRRSSATELDTVTGQTPKKSTHNGRNGRYLQPNKQADDYVTNNGSIPLIDSQLNKDTSDSNEQPSNEPLMRANQHTKLPESEKEKEPRDNSNDNTEEITHHHNSNNVKREMFTIYVTPL